MKLRSSIKTSLMRHTLMKGTLLAIVGAGILVYAGIVMPKDTLSLWGLPLLLISGGLITWGMLPYRKLTRLEKKPDELVLTNSHLHYLPGGKPALTIPQQSIERIAYLDRGTIYGIAIELKHPSPEKVIVQNNFNAEQFEKRSRERYDCDLFFPFFSENSAKILLN